MLTRVALIALVATVCVCGALQTDRETMRDGLSWFGVHRRTVVPYVTGMSLTAVLLAISGRSLRGRPGAAPDAVRRTAAGVLGWCAVLMIAIVATPYDLSTGFRRVHDSLGGVLFASQLAFTCWFWWFHRSTATTVALALELAAGVACLVALVFTIAVLLPGQVAFQVTFGTRLPGIVDAVGRRPAVPDPSRPATPPLR